MFNIIFTVAEVLLGLFAAILAAYIYISKARTTTGKEQRKRYIKKFSIYSISAISVLAAIGIILSVKKKLPSKAFLLNLKSCQYLMKI